MITPTHTLHETDRDPRGDLPAEYAADLGAEVPQADGRFVESGGRPESRGGPAGGGLPIADYPNLTVPEIIRHAGRMSLDELREVKAYEKSHRRRKTLLTKLERMLRGPAAAVSSGPPRQE